MPDYAPDPKMKFTFGLWTVGNVGRDPFGGPTREAISPVQICDMLGEVGAYGVNFHDNDLIPIDATSQEAERIKKDFRRALELNPNEVSIRLEYADALAGFGAPDDKAEATTQYQEALRYNSLLKPDEPKRLRPEKVAEIEKKLKP